MVQREIVVERERGAVFDVEGAFVTPAMLIVANEIAFRVGRQRRLTRTRQAE